MRRVLLSSVDFSGSTGDSMKVAMHLIQRGMKKELFKYLRTSAESSPTASASPYELGLPIALELDDLEAIRWTCVGILKNGWPEEKADLVEKCSLLPREPTCVWRKRSV